MKEELTLVFHHIGKPVLLESIKDNPDTKYSPLFDMYSLDMYNKLSIPIELHAFGEKSTLDKRIQICPHVAFKTNNIEQALEMKKLSCRCINHSQIIDVQWS